MMDELLAQFIVEGHELLQQASDDLLALEHDPTNAAHIDSAFRAVHTLKGSVGLFDFLPMQQVLHSAEDLLGAVRARHLIIEHKIINVLINCINLIEVWIEEIEKTDRLPGSAAEQARPVLEHFSALLKVDTKNIAVARHDTDLTWLPALLVRETNAVETAQKAGRIVTALRYQPSGDCFFRGDDPIALIRSVPDLIGLHIKPRIPWQMAELDPFACNILIEIISTAHIETIRDIFRFVRDEIVVTEIDHAAVTSPKISQISDALRETDARILRVDAERVDELVNIIGELIVANNGLAHLVRQAGVIQPGLARAFGTNQMQIERLVGDMQRAVTSIRMMPLSQLFRRLSRLVREIALKLNKEISFEIRGETVEADKSVIDRLFEPLLHVLRNAVDHGIEVPDIRTMAGKPAMGSIVLEALRIGDQVAITVTDDGAGIDPVLIRQAAKSRNLMNAEAIDALDDAAAIDLIFAPGFSTARTVTDTSGRGVGMDSVRTAVTALGGHTVVRSTPGRGSTIQLILPQAVVVTRIVTVRIGDERFGVLVDMIAETTSISVNRILPIRSGEAFVLRDRTIPLLRLSALLNLPILPRKSANIKVLITISGDQHIGIEVDGFADRIDVLMKPMTGLLAGMPGILGAALLGDGKVLMVLDLLELIE